MKTEYVCSKCTKTYSYDNGGSYIGKGFEFCRKCVDGLIELKPQLAHVYTNHYPKPEDDNKNCNCCCHD